MDKQKLDELRPCPFCGSMAELIETDDKKFYYHICENEECGLVDLTDHKTKEDAAKWWNTRPIEDKLQARIDKLIEQCNRESQIKNGLAESYIALRQNLKEVDEYLSSEIDDVLKSQNWREAMEEVYCKLRAHHLIEKK